jgi:hypothetical protein
MFALHGIPSIYNGQEIGAMSHPYETYGIFSASSTIRSLDQLGLFDFYKQLCRLRTMFPALHGMNFAEVPVTPGASNFAFRRWEGDQNVFALINMGSATASASLILPVSELNLDAEKTYYLTDLVTNEYIAGKMSDFDTVVINIAKYSTRMFVLADSVVINTGADDQIVSGRPEEFCLEQNYPNPFNSGTLIKYSLASRGHITMRIYDVLGREIATLIDEEKPEGYYAVNWSADYIPTGVYFCRLQTNSGMMTKKMLLVR